jgi:hypothetical protein
MIAAFRTAVQPDFTIVRNTAIKRGGAEKERADHDPRIMIGARESGGVRP